MQPTFDISEGFSVGDVINDDNAVRAPIVPKNIIKTTGYKVAALFFLIHILQ